MSEFEDQLRQEELARLQSEGHEGGEKTQTEYTDADGTVFEWDPHKKAWFPKIDADFIAKYQMSYGVDQAAESLSGSKTQTPDTAQQSETQQEYTKEEYDKYWRDYYNYYYHQQNEENPQEGDISGTPAAEGEPGNEVKSSESSITRQSSREQDANEEDKNSDYYHYFSQYYDENYIPSSSDDKNKDKEESDAQQSASIPKPEKKQQAKKSGEKRKTQADTGWVEIDDDKNTNVYVSGLPLDVTDDEFRELMSKCGLIMTNLVTKEPKFKLYRDEQGQPKGDGRCCYVKVESVNLALQFLDGSDLRSHKLHVERAKFTMKGKFDPKKKRKKLNIKEKKKLITQQQKLLDWKPEISETRMRWEKVVVLKHMFEPKEFENDPMLINELREDVRGECSKHGEVKKVVLYDRHPEGIMTVQFKEFECADLCVQALNGRWFAKKRISAETWDGKTKYEVEESTAEREDRLKKWSDFLESDETKTEPTTSAKTEPSESAITQPSNSATSASAGASSSDKTIQPESSASGVNSRDSVMESATERTSEASSSESAAAQ